MTLELAVARKTRTLKNKRRFSARRLIALRERKGWSALRLADEMGVTGQTIANWESGKMPSIDSFLDLADVLGVTEAELTERA